MIGAPLDEAIREQIQHLLVERQVNVRLTPLLEALHKNQGFNKGTSSSHGEFKAFQVHPYAWPGH
jgi:hypothetical protein